MIVDLIIIISNNCKLNLIFKSIQLWMNQKIVYSFLLYALFISGIYLASFGVLIPYYSSASGHD